MAVTFQPYSDDPQALRLPYRVGERTAQAVTAAGDLASRAGSTAVAAATAPVRAAQAVGSDFMSGFRGQRPTPADPAGPTNFSGPGIPQSQALTGLPLLTQGVTQPAQTPAPAQPARLTPEQQVAYISAGPPGLVAGPPVYSTGNAQGGTMVSSRGVQSVPANYGAGRTNTFNTMASLPTYQSAVSAPPRNDMPRNYAPDATAARSRELDASVAELVRRVQQPLMSYGDLFQRRGALAALQAMSGLAQGAGTNAVTAAGQQLDANTQMRGQDINERLGMLRDTTDRRGQNLNYDATMSGQNVQRELGQLGQLYSMAQAQMQADAQVRAAQAQGAATKESALERSRTKMAELYLRYPTAEVQRMVATGVDPEGNPISAENQAVLAERLRNANPAPAALFDEILRQQAASRR